MRHIVVVVVLIFIIPFTGWNGALFAQKQGRDYIDSLRNEAKKLAGDDTAKVKALIRLSSAYRTVNYDSALIHALDALRLAESISWKKGMAISHVGLGTTYRFKSQYSDALDEDFKALRLYQELGDKNGVALVYNALGDIFMYQQKYEEAVKYEVNALSVYKELHDKNGTAGVYSDLGIIYWQQKKYDSALSFCFTSLEQYKDLDYSANVARMYGNIGSIYEDKADYARSLKYNFLSLRGLKAIGNKRSLGIRYCSIGQAYLSAAEHIEAVQPDSLIPRGKSELLARAAAYLDSGIAIARQMGDLYDLQDGAKSRARVAELMGDYRMAYSSYLEYINVRDSVFSTENKVKIAQAEARHELELTQLALEKKKHERLFFITIILLLSVLGILFISRLAVKQKRLENDKRSAENELEVFKKNIYEKNAIIEQVTAEIGRLKENAEKDSDVDVTSQLQNSLILTDEQWDNFRVLFEKVHKNFFVNLKKKMPGLSQAEIRLLALTKLSLSSKEMAAMLGISPATIRIYRHRLRRKLNLDKEDMIEELVENL